MFGASLLQNNLVAGFIHAARFEIDFTQRNAIIHINENSLGITILPAPVSVPTDRHIDRLEVFETRMYVSVASIQSRLS